MSTIVLRFGGKEYHVGESDLYWIIIREIGEYDSVILSPLEWERWEDQFQPTNCYELAKDVGDVFGSVFVHDCRLYDPSTLEHVSPMVDIAYKCIEDGDNDEGLILIRYAYILRFSRPVVRLYYSRNLPFYVAAMGVDYLSLPVPRELWEGYGFRDDWVSECLDKLLSDLKQYVMENLETIKMLYKYYRFDRFINVDALKYEDIIDLVGIERDR